MFSFVRFLEVVGEVGLVDIGGGNLNSDFIIFGLFVLVFILLFLGEEVEDIIELGDVGDDLDLMGVLKGEGGGELFLGVFVYLVCIFRRVFFM